MALAVLGLATSLGITRVPAANPAKKFQANFPAELFRQIQSVLKDRPLTLAFAGNMYFTFLGLLLMLNLFFYGMACCTSRKSRSVCSAWRWPLESALGALRLVTSPGVRLSTVSSLWEGLACPLYA